MLYELFLAIHALEMLFETLISVRNSQTLIQKGALEITPGTLPAMIFLYVLMFLGSLVEHLWIARPLSFEWCIGFFILFCLAKLLKFWAIRSLGEYWTMRVLIVPHSSVATAGPYRWIRHPNYIAVLMEIAATTLLGKSYFTFAVVIVLFSVTLVFRIRSEESALRQFTDYGDQMATKRRFLP